MIKNCLYVIRFEDGGFYVGRTSNLSIRKNTHKQQAKFASLPVHKAMRTIGYTFEVWASDIDDIVLLDMLETQTIQQLESMGVKLYNIAKTKKTNYIKHIDKLIQGVSSRDRLSCLKQLSMNDSCLNRVVEDNVITWYLKPINEVIDRLEFEIEELDKHIMTMPDCTWRDNMIEGNNIRYEVLNILRIDY